MILERIASFATRSKSGKRVLLYYAVPVLFYSMSGRAIHHDAWRVLPKRFRTLKLYMVEGCLEVLMAKAVDEIAPGMGKEQLAIEAFARAPNDPTII